MAVVNRRPKRTAALPESPKILKIWGCSAESSDGIPHGWGKKAPIASYPVTGRAEWKGVPVGRRPRRAWQQQILPGAHSGSSRGDVGHQERESMATAAFCKSMGNLQEGIWWDLRFCDSWESLWGGGYCVVTIVRMLQAPQGWCGMKQCTLHKLRRAENDSGFKWRIPSKAHLPNSNWQRLCLNVKHPLSACSFSLPRTETGDHRNRHSPVFSKCPSTLFPGLLTLDTLWLSPCGYLLPHRSWHKACWFALLKILSAFPFFLVNNRRSPGSWPSSLPGFMNASWYFETNKDS